MWPLLLLAFGLVPAFSGSTQAFASAFAQQPQETAAPTAAAPQDPIAQLNLSPEQRQQIRAIREQSKEERALITRRLRETQSGLDQALDSENPSEAIIEQRAREAGEAQAASIRLRALTETRIRRVLTAEQVKTLRQLRVQAELWRREQRLENRAEIFRSRAVNGRLPPNQRNSMAPGIRRGNLLRRPRP